eukprot:4751719-Lingulodinium_polyedra.AAC.1
MDVMNSFPHNKSPGCTFECSPLGLRPPTDSWQQGRTGCCTKSCILAEGIQHCVILALRELYISFSRD